MNCRGPVQALPFRHHVALGWCHITTSLMHYLPRPLLDTRPKFTDRKLPAASRVALGQHGTLLIAAAVAQTRVRRRRRTQGNDHQDAQTAIESSENTIGACHQPGESILLYYPIKCEAEALELCRQAGYKLADFHHQQQELSSHVVSKIQGDYSKSAGEPMHGVAYPQQHLDMPEQQATDPLGKTGMSQQQQQQLQTAPTHQYPHSQQLAPQQVPVCSEPAARVQGKQAAVQPAPVAAVQPPAPRAAWQIAVDKRVQQANRASSRSISMARYRKWRGQPGRPPPYPAARRAPAVSLPPSGHSCSELPEHFMPELPRTDSSSTVAAFAQKYGSGQQLSPQAEAELCGMYQRYKTLGQFVQKELQEYQHSQQQQQPSAVTAVPSQLCVSSDIEVQGLMAQQLLLELYRPLIFKRANAAARRAPGADHGELVAAARQAVLHAASKFDASRAAENNARLATLADMHVRNAIRAVQQEYQAGALTLPPHVTELQRKLQHITAKHQQLHHSKPTVQELAAAAAVSVLQVKRALAASAIQSAGLSDTGGDDIVSEQHGSGINLQLLDVTDSVEDLDNSVAQGAVKASRSGLQEEQEQAAQAELLASVMQQYLMNLSGRDRDLLALRLGIHLHESARSGAAPEADAQAEEGSSRSHEQQRGIANEAARAVSSGDVDAAKQLQDLVVEEQSMSLEELARHFNVNSRQRAHQLLEGAVKQLRQQLQQAAEQDAKVAQLLSGSKLAK